MEKYNTYLNMNDNDIDNLLLGLDIKKKNNKVNKCLKCKSTNFVFDDIQGHTVCRDCGTINNIILNNTPEYSNNNEASNYGCPSNFFCPKSSLGTKMRSKGYSRLSAIQRQGQVQYSEKEFLITIKRIEEKCNKYKIKQPIIDTAKTLYKKIKDYKHVKGKRKGKNMIMRCTNRRSMIAACIFYACKLQNEPRSPKEIADIYDLEVKHVNRGYRKFLDYVNMDIFFKNFKSSQSSDFIIRYASRLGLDKKYAKIAKDVSINIHKLDIVSTHEPSSVAAGCILLIAKMYSLDKINKKKISEVFKISDVTISKTYRRIYHFHQIITNNELTDLICKKQKNAPKQKIEVNKNNLVISNAELLSESETEIIKKKEKKEKRDKKKKEKILKI